jgi:gliding motility-associated-like protein
MELKKIIRIAFLFLLVFFSMQKAMAQCFQIKSILVDACGGLEGFNEMVRFETGSTPLNGNTLIVSWPNNSWQGIVQNGTTAGLTSAFNADILAAGGCGQLIEPPGGIVPANATVILFTSYNVDTAANGFGPLNENIYVLYQNNGSTSTGHFANTGSGIRTLSMVSGTCSDTVSYDRGQLTGGNGAAVNYTDSGTPGYINNGCMAPVSPFTVDAGLPATVCAGATISLSGNAEGQASVLWSAASGSFTSSGNVNTNYTIDPAATGTIVLTLSATNACGTTISDAVTINITSGTIPNFPTILTICNGAAIPALNGISPNGISGMWNPATVSNTASGSYTFTPNPGQCATTMVLNVTVDNNVVPNFITSLNICNGGVVPVLNATSPNGISGSWNPAVISNTVGGSYVFTPNPGQCAVNAILTVVVNNAILPDFPVTLTLCGGSAAPVLNAVSPNGITGTWNPANISNATSGAYIFTPNPGQCATTATLNVNITNAITPDFATTMSICNGTTLPALNGISPNGVTGTWNPMVIDNTLSANYTFTPDVGQCAIPVVLSVTVNNNIIPDFPTSLAFCNGENVPILNATSPNGISGTWNPATISNTLSANYIFTPNAGQCATNAILVVTITNNIVPDFPTSLVFCNGDTVPVLNSVSPNGITGSWNPTNISNTTSATYIFTPDAGQCATTTTLNITVNNNIIPNFATVLTLCNGSTPPALNSTSLNGISGSWNPATINNTASGNYIFTPNPGQCATGMVLQVTVNGIVPNFPSAITICENSTSPVLDAISPNGVTGNWNPAVISNTATGNYTFIPDAGQCAQSVSLQVTIAPQVVPVTAFSYNSPVCANANNIFPMLLTGFSSGGNFTSDPGLVINPATGEINVALSAPGLHTITYQINPNPAACNPGGVNTFVLTIIPARILPVAGNNTVCTGNSILLSNPVPGGSWTSSNTNIATIDVNGLVTGIAPGQTVITYTQNTNGCIAFATKTITVSPFPVVELHGGFLCIDPITGQHLSSVYLNCGIPVAGHTFAWTFDGDALPTTGNNHFATVPGVYEVTVTDTVSGCSASASTPVGVSSMAIADAAVGQDFNDNQTITIHVTGGSGQYEFQLDDGPFQDSNVFTNISQGEYTITIKDKKGCDDLVLTVYALNYPHFFTPNHDGFNDVWNIKGLSQQNALIYIFDRYGKLLKTLKPSENSGWDGTYNGNPLPSSDYWFELIYHNRQDSKAAFRAHFSLKR